MSWWFCHKIFPQHQPGLATLPQTDHRRNVKPLSCNKSLEKKSTERSTQVEQRSILSVIKYSTDYSDD